LVTNNIIDGLPFVKHYLSLNRIYLATETGWDEDRTEDCVFLDARNWCEKENEEAKRIEPHRVF
jgi:hypothetical protein